MSERSSALVKQLYPGCDDGKLIIRSCSKKQGLTLDLLGTPLIVQFECFYGRCDTLYRDFFEQRLFSFSVKRIN